MMDQSTNEPAGSAVLGGTRPAYELSFGGPCGPYALLTVWLAYQRSPVALRTRPSRPALPSNALHLAQTGSISRFHEPSNFRTVSVHFAEALRLQKMHLTSSLYQTAG